MPLGALSCPPVRSGNHIFQRNVQILGLRGNGNNCGTIGGNNGIYGDDIGFKIENGNFSLSGIRKVGPDFEAKEFETTFDHVIETPDIVYKKYMEMKNK